MAGLDNPFGRLLDTGENGPNSVLGIIGRLTGAPNRAADASSDATQQILMDIQRGTPPQKAVVNFFSTPAGQEAFVRNPNIMQQIGETIKTITPPTPQAVQTGPGGQTNLIGPGGVVQGTFTQPTAENQNFREQGRVVNTPAGGKSTVMGPGGEVQQTITNPTTAAQDFKTMADIAKLPPEELQKIAQANLLVNGRYKISPIHNATGDVVGVSVLDTLTGNVMTPDSAGIGPQRPPSEVPGVSTVPSDMRNQDGSVDISKLVSGRAGMFIGSGLWPQVLSGLSNTMGSFIHPSLNMDAGHTATQQRNNLEDLRTAVTIFPETVGRTNRVIDQMRKNLDFGMFTDPLSATTTSIQFHDDIQREIAAAENTIKDLSLPKNVRIQAEKDRQGFNRILRALPSRGEMVEMEKAIKGNKIPGLGASAAGSAIVEGARKVIGAGKKAAQGGDVGDATTTTTAPQVTMDFSKMAPADLAKVNPKSLSHDQRLQLQQRLKEVFKTAP